MKYLFLIFLVCVAGLCSCKDSTAPAEEIKPKTAVTIVSVANRPMEQFVMLPAVSKYLQHNTVLAPIAGYIHFGKINFNDHVSQGQLLYTIETKERRALDSDVADGGINGAYGLINVYAPANGVITSVQQWQKGDFVSEGGTLCTIANDKSLFFQINVPYEYNKQVKANPECPISLPDGTGIKTRIGPVIAQATSGLQAISYMAKPVVSVFVPENLTAYAKIVINKTGNAQTLPKPAVLSDELMQHFWVMKLINDSVAVKVPVTIGQQNDSLTEIKTPLLTPDDRILLNGNYGLPDTALVKIP